MPINIDEKEIDRDFMFHRPSLAKAIIGSVIPMLLRCQHQSKHAYLRAFESDVSLWEQLFGAVCPFFHFLIRCCHSILICNWLCTHDDANSQYEFSCYYWRELKQRCAIARQQQARADRRETATPPSRLIEYAIDRSWIRSVWKPAFPKIRLARLDNRALGHQPGGSDCHNSSV